MASGSDGRLTRSVLMSSDTYYNFICRPCDRDNRITEAVKYCIDCGEDMCRKCVDTHRLFTALRNHVMEDCSKDKTTKPSQDATDTSNVVYQGNSVTIAISHVSLRENCTAMTNESISQLFVAYNFLGIDPAQTETPFSQPKPKPFHTRQFNFSKTFLVDLENNYSRRQCLARMLLPSDPDSGRIRFTLVSEPPEEDKDVDCDNVGVAIVSIRDILRHRQDVTAQDIDIVDIADEEKVIGSMNLTVQCLEALESVEKEMQVKENEGERATAAALRVALREVGMNEIALDVLGAS